MNATARLRADDGPCYAELKADIARVWGVVEYWQEEYLTVNAKLAALRASRARELCLVGAVSLAVGLAAWPLAIILVANVP